MKLQLTLSKTGEVAKRLALPLTKGAKFHIELAWDSEHDLDAHALLAMNSGNGAKVGAFEQILSTYGIKQGSVIKNPDGSFRTKCGALTHSGDKRDGRAQGVDEMITVDTALIDAAVNEIPFFVTIHGSDKNGATFARVKDASITIKDEADKVLGQYVLSSEFGQFNAVQMGSLMRTATNDWEFAEVGSGFNGTFNDILGHFSE